MPNARSQEKKTMLKPYCGFSRAGGPAECAVLILAHSAREARKVGWQGTCCDITDEYIDFAVRLMRDSEHLLKHGNVLDLASDQAHVVWDVPDCKQCECWGDPIGPDGLCPGCRDDNLLEKAAEKVGECD
jgi:hypothetical protein